MKAFKESSVIDKGHIKKLFAFQMPHGPLLGLLIWQCSFAR